ncbi:MAG: TspO/MBR family protein [Hominimerdicola sp.]
MNYNALNHTQHYGGNKKALAVCLAVPFAVQLLTWLFTQNAAQVYGSLILPQFAPPTIIFPFVWTILYLLMGISSYLILMTDSEEKFNALSLYAFQLLVNFIWCMFFFDGKMFLLSSIVLCILLMLIFAMIVYFYRIRRSAALLQVPYFLWTVFAGYLNFSVYILN